MSKRIRKEPERFSPEVISVSKRTKPNTSPPITPPALELSQDQSEAESYASLLQQSDLSHLSPDQLFIYHALANNPEAQSKYLKSVPSILPEKARPQRNTPFVQGMIEMSNIIARAEETNVEQAIHDKTWDFTMYFSTDQEEYKQQLVLLSQSLDKLASLTGFQDNRTPVWMMLRFRGVTEEWMAKKWLPLTTENFAFLKNMLTSKEEQPMTFHGASWKEGTMLVEGDNGPGSDVPYFGENATITKLKYIQFITLSKKAMKMMRKDVGDHPTQQKRMYAMATDSKYRRKMGQFFPFTCKDKELYNKYRALFYRYQIADNLAESDQHNTFSDSALLHKNCFWHACLQWCDDQPEAEREKHRTILQDTFLGSCISGKKSIINGVSIPKSAIEKLHSQFPPSHPIMQYRFEVFYYRTKSNHSSGISLESRPYGLPSAPHLIKLGLVADHWFIYDVSFIVKLDPALHNDIKTDLMIDGHCRSSLCLLQHFVHNPLFIPFSVEQHHLLQSSFHKYVPRKDWLEFAQQLQGDYGTANRALIEKQTLLRSFTTEQMVEWVAKKVKNCKKDKVAAARRAWFDIFEAVGKEVTCAPAEFRFPYYQNGVLLHKKDIPMCLENVWTFDFETYIDQGRHLPKCVSAHHRTSNITITKHGLDCFSELMKKIPNGSVLYAHNFGKFDANFVIPHLEIDTVIEKSVDTYELLGRIHGNTYLFRDSYKMINGKLESLPMAYLSQWKQEHIQGKTYQTQYAPCIKFESPYELYSFAEEWMPLALIEDHYKDKKKQRDDFLNQNQQFIVDDKINFKAHLQHYCEQDCIVLANVLENYQKLFLGNFPEGTFHGVLPFQYNIFQFVTSSSIGYRYLEDNVFTFTGQTEDRPVYKFGGAIRGFEQQSILGGRTMTRRNAAYYIHGSETKICDFDAVSLYPSAMSRLYTFIGAPKSLPPLWCDQERLLALLAGEQEQVSEERPIGGFTIMVRLTSLQKHLDFPTLASRAKSGSVEWTNDISHHEILFLTEIQFVDAIIFQQAEFEVLGGYWWGEKDFHIQEAIQNLFEFRKNNKKHTIQLIIKLMMNSGYGKSAMKEMSTVIKYFSCPKKTDGTIDHSKLMDYMLENGYRVKEMNQINDRQYRFVEDCPIFAREEYFPNWFASRVLAMSKRIMHEVMTLAQDLSIDVWYTDTDSMHIDLNGIPRLEVAFEEKYGRKLCGSNLGQFHAEFDVKNGNPDKAFSTCFIGIGKKMYYDRVQAPFVEQASAVNADGVRVKLFTDDGQFKPIFKQKGTTNDDFTYSNDTIEADFFRLKGIPSRLIQGKEDYIKLFSGETVTYDLAAGRPIFVKTKDKTITMQPKFEREVKKLVNEESTFEIYN